MADFTGEEEEEFILTVARTLAGGRAWDTQVPDDVTLPRDEATGALWPYIVVRFASPSASAQGRNIATGEQGQPHLLSFTTITYSGDADSAAATDRELRRLLVGVQPSDTATPIRSSGGFAYSDSETGSRPTRFGRSSFYRTIINK